jgi:hypothetical protein
MTELRADVDRRMADLERRLGDLDGKREKRVGDLRAELIKWMFIFWLGTVASMPGFGRFLAP